MKLKTILIGSAIAIAALMTPAPPGQAQTCPEAEVIPPVEETRVIRKDRYNFRFNIPTNYRAMATSGNTIYIFDPNSFKQAQCQVRNKVPTELPQAISVSVQPVNPGDRSIADLVRQRPTAENVEPTTVAEQMAVTYNEKTLGYTSEVAFFTPNRNYRVTISAPFEFEQNARGEFVPDEIFNERVFETVISSFTFV
jgi:hypothetical protein